MITRDLNLILSTYGSGVSAENHSRLPDPISSLCVSTGWQHCCTARKAPARPRAQEDKTATATARETCDCDDDECKVVSLGAGIDAGDGHVWRTGSGTVDNMKLLGKELEKDSSGSIGLIPEEVEDMWHAYNLVAVGDRVRASTIRKVTTESATGSTTSNRVRTTLTLEVTDIDFDAQGCKLRLKGKNVAENAHVKMGAYHTIDLEPNRKFTLTKAEWDSVALERIELATDPARHADLAAIVMQEGLAHVCLVTSSMTIVRAKIDLAIPRKRRGGTSQHERALTRFYDAVLQALQRHVDFGVVKAVIVASPGFVRDKFLEYVNQHAIRNDVKVLVENKSKFVSVHSSSGFKHSLKEVLQDPAVQARLADTKAAEEVRALENFYKTLSADPLRACYGEKHVMVAVEHQAVEQLLISDSLFRSQEVARRKKFVRVVDDVREFGGDVKIFSSLHVSGEQLDQLTGICAVLRFPMQELDEEDSDESDSD